MGAGAGLPALSAALNGAKKVLLTDYPDINLISNLSHNVTVNLPPKIASENVKVEGYLWGKDVTPLLQFINNGNNLEQKFDIIILSDLLSNHGEHEHILETCKKCLAKDGKVLLIALRN